MAKGIIIRYKMAEFIPWAGFSPSCRDVLVQTEHWAAVFCAEKNPRKMNNNIPKKYFIAAAKVRQQKLYAHNV